MLSPIIFPAFASCLGLRFGTGDELEKAFSHCEPEHRATMLYNLAKGHVDPGCEESVRTFQIHPLF